MYPKPKSYYNRRILNQDLESIDLIEGMMEDLGWVQGSRF